MTKRKSTIIFLLVITSVAVYFCYLLVVPFLKSIVFSGVLAIIFYPAHVAIQARIRSRNLAAGLSTTVIILLITVPSVFLGHALATGLRDAYQALLNSGETPGSVNSHFLSSLERALAWTSNYIPMSANELRRTALSQTEKVLAVLLGWTAGAVGSVTSILVDALIGFFVLFFFLRDGKSMLRRAAVILPLKTGYVIRLFSRVKETLFSIVYGSLFMAALQGALTGIAFWLLGLASPVLWGSVAGICALLPMFGTALVWLPASIILILGGHWAKGLILTVCGIAIIHPVDNLLRPILIGGRARLSTLLVFFALLGGLKAFGGLGVFIGPSILAVTVALFTFLNEERHAGNRGLFEQEEVLSPEP